MKVEVEASPGFIRGTLAKPEENTPYMMPGFYDLHAQVVEQAVKTGFVLNILILGMKGTGKRSFITTFLHFLANYQSMSEQERKDNLENVYSTTNALESCKKQEKGNIKEHEVVLKTYYKKTDMERGGSLSVKFAIVDYGGEIDNTGCETVIVDYLKSKFNDEMKMETKPDRKILKDNKRDQKIHCCLLFLGPSGHGNIHPCDITVLKAIHNIVNVIPVIGRSDSLETGDLNSQQKHIRDQINKENIQLFSLRQDFPKPFPLAIVTGTNKRKLCKNDEKRVYGRKLGNGVCQVDDPEQSDFLLLLRIMYVEYFTLLKARTEEIYEQYRAFNLLKKKPYKLPECKCRQLVCVCERDEIKLPDWLEKLWNNFSEKFHDFLNHLTIFFELIFSSVGDFALSICHIFLGGVFRVILFLKMGVLGLFTVFGNVWNAIRKFIREISEWIIVDSVKIYLHHSNLRRHQKKIILGLLFIIQAFLIYAILKRIETLFSEIEVVKIVKKECLLV